jgi:hypothetical protein
MTNFVSVKSCADCIFWERHQEMSCSHPDSPKEAYSNLISWENVERKTPKWCPLRVESCDIRKSINGKIISHTILEYHGLK